MRGLFNKIRKLQLAINCISSQKISVNTTQWYSDKQKRVVNKYIVKRQVEPKSKQYEQLFYSYSNLQIVLFLRDYYYIISGREVPDDNEYWNAIKENNKDVYDYIRNGEKKKETSAL